MNNDGNIDEEVRNIIETWFNLENKFVEVDNFLLQELTVPRINNTVAFGCSGIRMWSTLTLNYTGSVRFGCEYVPNVAPCATPTANILAAILCSVFLAWTITNN